jgi:hypothetical protein
MTIRRWFLLTAAFLMFLQAGVAHADVNKMLGACRERAANKLGVSVGSVHVKYEGQRTDGTHAVNGSARAQGQERTFQCSFNSAGKRVGWVLNPAPAASHAAAPHKGAPGTPSKQEQACLAAVSREANNGEVMVLSSEFSQANSLVMVGVGAQRAPWRCLVSNDGVVAEVFFAGSEGDL